MPAMTFAYSRETGLPIMEDFFRIDIEKWPPGTKQNKIRTGQTETFYLDTGESDKPVMVLLHGTAQMGVMLHESANLLHKDFRLIAPDIPGESGFSSAQCIPGQISFYIDWFNELLDELGMHSIYLTGASLGSFLGMHIASDMKKRLLGLGLLAPVGISNPTMRFIIKALSVMNSPSVSGYQRFFNFLRGKGLPPMEAEEIRNIMTFQRHCKPFHKVMPKRVDGKVLEGIACPVYICMGADEVSVNVKKTQSYIKKHLPQAELNLVRERAHIVTAEDYRGIIDFLLK